MCSELTSQNHKVKIYAFQNEEWKFFLSQKNERLIV